MAHRTRPSLALLVSVLVHAGIALFLVGQAGCTGGAGAGAAQQGRALTVSLLASTPAAVHGSAPALAVAAAEAAKPALTHSVPVAAGNPAAEAAAPGTAQATAPEHHYFGASETTQQAEVVEGLLHGRLLIVPGLPPQEVSLQVWISDEGVVERVELDSPLPEEQQQLLLAAFAKVRFNPGRIGRIAVHSRISMKIVVDYAIRA
ncbi:hypothetical protein [Pseudoduganella violaceinigra]|uniref:hypothetical protein n=1 Tax=Pseudoduganella violaceinigra TaxID=246602 RepID=UPI0003F701AF|nr:hypothetical protein [Pseudoduganella violaceinigra]